jgi:hypothetical protein
MNIQNLIYFGLFSISVGATLCDYFAHHPNSFGPAGSTANLSLAEIGGWFDCAGAKPVDAVIGPLPFVLIWIDMIPSFTLVEYLTSFACTPLLIVFITSRMCALQELSHYTMHSTFCRIKKAGDRWANLFSVLLFCAIVTYPQASWLSELVEQRWYAPQEGFDWLTRECNAGHRLELSGITSPFVRVFLLPSGDHLHLAHSLFPNLPFNYLPSPIGYSPQISQSIEAMWQPDYSPFDTLTRWHNSKIGWYSASRRKHATSWRQIRS